MSHKPIHFQNIGLFFPQKLCFEGFSTVLLPGSRVALIGQNGQGKSSLLKMISGTLEPSQGELYISKDTLVAHVPQVIEEYETLSGGQRLNEALTKSLAMNPDILLLDEPTNHLDQNNRCSIMRLLQNYKGTLVMATHDVEILRKCVTTFWHIESGKIHIFSGKFDDLMHERKIQRSALEDELNNLNREKKETHHALMKEQSRASKSKKKGEKHIKQRKWPTIVSREKARRAVETAGRKKAAIRQNKDELLEQLSHLHLPEIIKPSFTLSSSH